MVRGSLCVASASTAQSTAGDLAFHARGFELSLASANKRPNTIKSYLEAVEQLDAFLGAQGMPRDVENIRREHVESFQPDQLERLKPACAANLYRSLQQFCIPEPDTAPAALSRRERVSQLVRGVQAGDLSAVAALREMLGG